MGQPELVEETPTDETVTSEQAFEAAWAEANGETIEPEAEKTEETAEVEESAEEESGEQPDDTAETEEVEEVEEEKLAPHQHWPAEIKETFAGMTRPQQETWMERERTFEQGFQAKAGELNGAKQAIDEFQGMISPLVDGWQRQGITPSAGLMKMVALERDLRENPAQALIGLASQVGVDLQQEVASQPYVDPQTKAIQNELRELKESREREQRETEQRTQLQQQYATENAKQQFFTFANATDESGKPKYPYVNTKEVMGFMGEAMQGGQFTTLEAAYEGAIAYMRNHPFYKDQVTDKTQSVKQKVERAKKASKTVESKANPGSTSASLDAQIMEQLEAHGITE